MGQNKIKFIIGSVLIVAAIGYLINTSISKTSMYFFTVDELVKQNVSYQGTGLKVKGNVVAGSITRNPDDYLDVSFTIEEKDSNLQVAYKGVTPDMFEDGREVVVEGTLREDGVFHANTLLTSCPSKYEAEKEKGGMHPDSIPRNSLEKKQNSDQPFSLPKTTI